MGKTHNMVRLIGFTCAALFLAGCAKEQLKPITANDLASIVVPKVNMRYLYETEFNTYYCEGSSGSCLPDLTVTKQHAPKINEVFEAVVSGVQMDIVAAFTTNRSVLLNYLSEEHIDKVISETYTATAGNGVDSKFLFMGQDDLILAAYPMYEEK